ncbi:MAG TPA: tetratricopeptide repeat protein [Vicinamibacterales bacterium]|nr:tetratricopeptide repeat protein [Vicinamibacterales bacterium]
MRVLVLSVALVASVGCAERRLFNVTPDRPDRTEATTAGAPADSLSAYMAKFREMQSHARPEGRPPLRTVEATDPGLAAALLAATAAPSPEAYRAVAGEYRRVRVYDKAHDYLAYALKLDPKDAMTHDALARTWRDAGFPHLAVGDAYRAIHYAPKSAAPRNTLGTLFQAMGRRAEARAQYEIAATLDPAAGYVHNNLCYGWILEGDASKALQACRRALSLDPESPIAHNNTGLAYALAGDMTAARTAFAHAGRAAAAYNSGVVNLATQNWDGASKDFLDAFAADPSLRDAAMRARQAWSMQNGGTK